LSWGEVLVSSVWPRLRRLPLEALSEECLDVGQFLLQPGFRLQKSQQRFLHQRREGGAQPSRRLLSIGQKGDVDGDAFRLFHRWRRGAGG